MKTTSCLTAPLGLLALSQHPVRLLSHEWVSRTGNDARPWENVRFNSNVVEMRWKPQFNWMPKAYKEREVPVPTDTAGHSGDTIVDPAALPRL